MKTNSGKVVGIVVVLKFGDGFSEGASYIGK